MRQERTRKRRKKQEMEHRCVCKSRSLYSYTQHVHLGQYTTVYSLIGPLLFHCPQADSLEAETIVEAALSQFGKDHVSLM